MAHILVVEDNDLVSGALRTLLEATGHRVSVAGSVAQAIAVVDTDRPALTLLDLTLPDGDGLGVARHIVSANGGNAGASDSMVIALTGRDERETIEACASAGCKEVLVKPVPIRDLMIRVREWVGEAD